MEMHLFYVSFNDSQVDLANRGSIMLNRLKVSKFGRPAMRLKFYKIKNQQEKILYELKKIFNVKDSSDQDRIRYCSSPFFEEFVLGVNGRIVYAA